MSYQFEDESALEELLNQQLDRKRQLTSGPASAKLPSSTGIRQENITNLLPTSNQRPISAIISKQAIFDETAPTIQANVAKNKLVGWLNETNEKNKTPLSSLEMKESIKSKIRTTDQAINMNENDDVIIEDDEINKMINETIRDDQLQDMSKQRLIKLILSQIVPILKTLQNEGGKKVKIENERLKKELELEKDKLISAEISLSEEKKTIELRLLETRRELEVKLESKERELIENSERFRSLIVKLEDEQRKQVASLSDNYQIRLKDERREFEETLKRRDEFYQMELESKLRVNYDVAKMETIFSEWNNMIQVTSRELEVQFKSAESLLEKQTMEIRGTNSDLVQKTKRLCDEYEKFEHERGKLGELAQTISKLLPDLTEIQKGSKSVFEQTNKQLAALAHDSDHLKAREAQLERAQVDLSKARDELAEERLAWGVKWNKLECKSERIDELEKGIERRELHLDERIEALEARESKLDDLRAGLDKQSVELKHSNYELHLARRTLLEQEHQLKVRDSKLAEEIAELQRMKSQVTRVMSVREKMRKEMDQLRRLEKSLVCSICLDRLFKNDKNNKCHLRQIDSQGLENELAKLSRYAAIDESQLKSESKYIELLSGN